MVDYDALAESLRALVLGVPHLTADLANASAHHDPTPPSPKTATWHEASLSMASSPRRAAVRMNRLSMMISFL